jgi:hypothetical protein
MNKGDAKHFKYRIKEASRFARSVQLLAPIVHDATITFTEEKILLSALLSDKSVYARFPREDADKLERSDGCPDSVTIGADLNTLVGWMRNIKDGIDIEFLVDFGEIHPKTHLPAVQLIRYKHGTRTVANLCNLNLPLVEIPKKGLDLDNLGLVETAVFDSVLSAHLANHAFCSIKLSGINPINGKLILTFTSTDPILHKTASSEIFNVTPVRECFVPTYRSKTTRTTDDDLPSYEIKQLKKINKGIFKHVYIGIKQGDPLLVSYPFEGGGGIEFRVLSREEIRARDVLAGRATEEELPAKKGKLHKRKERETLKKDSSHGVAKEEAKAFPTPAPRKDTIKRKKRKFNPVTKYTNPDKESMKAYLTKVTKLKQGITD